MANLINGKEYYCSHVSEEHARTLKRAYKYVGKTSKDEMIFEDSCGSCWNMMYAVEIPKGKYIPWDESTRPLFGAFQSKATKFIYFPSGFDFDCVLFGNRQISFEKLLKNYYWIPDLTKPNDLYPCGVKTNDTK